ncbi:MAG: hypothetical protein H7248_09940 [Microbacteriaceae bacterium]|nr:hypothetical protein [Microbacteriaceae bacterium]
MSVGPRVVFLRFLSEESPKLKPWRAHYASVTGKTPETISRDGDGDRGGDRGGSSSESGVVTWHLVSANNRPLGRSGSSFLAFADAVDDAQRAVAACHRLEVVLVAHAVSGRYGWFAIADGAVVITCARWYLTERDRRKSIALATDSLAIAALGAGARSINPALMMSSVRETTTL